MTDGAPASFEQKLERIDAIVKELEGGRVELDRAIALFQEGKKLSAECESLLKAAQETVDRAMSDQSRA
jgi:exodeoxyribonuclease VII small subunit